MYIYFSLLVAVRGLLVFLLRFSSAAFGILK
jgi:hypothetical protein